jgi:hypothetical protein
MPAGPRDRIKAKESKRQVIRSKLGSDEEEDDDNEEVPSLKRKCFQLDRKIPGILTPSVSPLLFFFLSSFLLLISFRSLALRLCHTAPMIILTEKIAFQIEVFCGIRVPKPSPKRTVF